MTAVERTGGAVWWVETKATRSSSSSPKRAGLHQPKPSADAVTVSRPDGGVWCVDLGVKQKKPEEKKQGTATKSADAIPSTAASKTRGVKGRASVLIYVFRNGDKNDEGRSVFIRYPKNMADILQQVQRHVAPVKGMISRLLSQDMKPLLRASNLVAHDWYLAVGSEGIWPPPTFLRLEPKHPNTTQSRRRPSTAFARAASIPTAGFREQESDMYIPLGKVSFFPDQEKAASPQAEPLRLPPSAVPSFKMHASPPILETNLPI